MATIKLYRDDLIKIFSPKAKSLRHVGYAMNVSETTIRSWLGDEVPEKFADMAIGAAIRLGLTDRLYQTTGINVVVE